VADGSPQFARHLGIFWVFAFAIGLNAIAILHLWAIAIPE
jgi:hypothetical protein